MSRLVLTDPKEDDTVAYISFSMIKYPQIARLLIAVHFIVNYRLEEADRLGLRSRC